MLDKICSFLLLPFYGLWKAIIDSGTQRKEFQEKIFPLGYLSISIAYMSFYFSVSNLLLKIVFAVLAITTLSNFFSSYLKVLLLKQLENGYLKDKWKLYKKLILYIVTSFTVSIYFKYFPILFVSLSHLIFLFIFVGFEFPDEPPKKEKKQENGSWLAKLLHPKLVTNV